MSFKTFGANDSTEQLWMFSIVIKQAAMTILRFAYLDICRFPILWYGQIEEAFCNFWFLICFIDMELMSSKKKSNSQPNNDESSLLFGVVVTPTSSRASSVKEDFNAPRVCGVHPWQKLGHHLISMFLDLIPILQYSLKRWRLGCVIPRPSSLPLATGEGRVHTT